MLTTLLYSLAGLLVAWALVTYVFPVRFVALLLRITRRLVGLKTRSITVDDRHWTYLQRGEDLPDVLLLLHGFGGDKDNWLLYAHYFRRGYRLIVPDLPGFGENFRDDRDDYSMAAQSERLRAFLQALNIERVHIAGNSMGGFLALRFALDYPDAVRTITLLNNAGVIGEGKSELEIMAERGESPLVVRSERDFDWLLKFIVFRPMPVPRVFKRYFCARAVVRQDFLDHVFWSLFREIKEAPLNDDLPRVTAPTLVVWGRHDRLIDVSCSDVIEAQIPDSRRVVFEDVGHVPMLECPGRTAAAHHELLRERRA